MYGRVCRALHGRSQKRGIRCPWLLGVRVLRQCLGLSRQILALFTHTEPWRYFRLQLPEPSASVVSCRRAAALVKTLARAGIERDQYQIVTKLILAHVVPAAGW